MVRYQNCQIFRLEKRDKVLATVDIEATSALNVYSSFEYDKYREDRQMTVLVKETEYDLNRAGYHILVPSVGEFKITSFYKKQVNAGHYKPKYRYTLTLEG